MLSYSTISCAFNALQQENIANTHPISKNVVLCVVSRFMTFLPFSWRCCPHCRLLPTVGVPCRHRTILTNVASDELILPVWIYVRRWLTKTDRGFQKNFIKRKKSVGQGYSWGGVVIGEVQASAIVAISRVGTVYAKSLRKR